jgi:thioredoxin reductase (NADPH)
MLTISEIEKVSLFASLSPAQRERLCRTAADLHVRAGDWLTREGDMPSFFVVIEGSVEFLKEFGGVMQQVEVYSREEFFGEVPLLLGARVFVGLRARVDSRIIRIDGSHFHDLIAQSRKWSERVLEVMATRVGGVQQMVREARASRVLIAGDTLSPGYRDILQFLSRLRVPHSVVDRQIEPDLLPASVATSTAQVAAVVDGQTVLLEPTERQLAAALGLRTQPSALAYDVVIVGGGPAGLAAAVCGSSEGLKVLIVEQAIPGGQAGTSSRIENYLGFPAGISGDELSGRALDQARRFGAEIVISTKVEQIGVVGEEKTLTLNGNLKVAARSIVLAIGVEWRLLVANGIDRLTGHGVVYGAGRTEALSVVGKMIFIVGGGNSAGQAALYLSSYAAQVVVVVRGDGLSQSMSQYLIFEIERKSNIAVEAHTEIVEVEGVLRLETVATKNRQTGDVKVRHAAALFVMIGAKANTAWLPVEILRDQHGYVCTGQDIENDWRLGRSPYPLETSVPGVFCVGDVRHGSIKRVASGVGEGSTSITFVHQYLSRSQPALDVAPDCLNRNAAQLLATLTI